MLLNFNSMLFSFCNRWTKRHFQHLGIFLFNETIMLLRSIKNIGFKEPLLVLKWHRRKADWLRKKQSVPIVTNPLYLWADLLFMAGHWCDIEDGEMFFGLIVEFFIVPNIRTRTSSILIRFSELPDGNVFESLLHSSGICIVFTSKADSWTLGQAAKIVACISVIIIILNYFTAFFFFIIKYKHLKWFSTCLSKYIF